MLPRPTAGAVLARMKPMRPGSGCGPTSVFSRRGFSTIWHAGLFRPGDQSLGHLYALRTVSHTKNR